jgi:2-haloacid dehalogenase
MRARMPIPKNVSFLTFDVYGTLIDWEAGIYEAFEAEAQRDGFQLPDRAELIGLFHEISREIEAGSYELYAEVLRRTVIEIARRIDWSLEPSRSGFLPESVQRWKPFRETNPQLQKLSKKYKLGLISNIDDKLLGQTRRHIPTDFDLVVTAQQVRSYKPEPAHFVEFARRIGGKKGWVHVGASHYHDIVPCLKQRVPVIWVNRSREALEPSQRKPTAEVHNLREAAKLLGVS